MADAKRVSSVVIRGYALRVLAAALVVSTIGGCASWRPASALKAEILGEGTLDCFSSGLKTSKGEAVYCEASAAVVSGDEIILASDKVIPGSSSFFAVRLDKDKVIPGSARSIHAKPLLAASKIEAMTKTLDGAYVLATTAFDRYDAKSAKLDAYDTLLIWPTGKPEQARVIAPNVRDGVTSSIGLRERFAKQIGKPYFKIEGMTVLPGERLVFGVREAGQDYDHFDYRILLIEIGFRISSDGEFTLLGEFRTLADLQPPKGAEFPPGLGLSSIEYDARSGRIYMTLSHESEGNILGAYLWYSDPDFLSRGQGLIPVRGADGRPLHVECKAEGIALLPQDRLFLICDDDRVLGGKYKRQPHQAAYIVLRITARP